MQKSNHKQIISGCLDSDINLRSVPSPQKIVPLKT